MGYPSWRSGVLLLGKRQYATYVELCICLTCSISICYIDRPIMYLRIKIMACKIVICDGLVPDLGSPVLFVTLDILENSF